MSNQSSTGKNCRDREETKSRREAELERYDELNPSLKLLNSDELKEEIREIVNGTRAEQKGGKVAHGSDNTVTVELVFDVDDFPELFPGGTISDE